MKICRTVLGKKMIVDYKLTDNKGAVSDIRPHKDQQPAPAQQQGTTSEKSTSPEKPPAAAPAGKPKTVEGQIVAIDHGTHELSVKDKAGTVHRFVWPASTKMTNNKGEPLKQWWFTRATGEPAGDVWKLTSHAYFKRPDDWPFGKGGNGSGQPRNDKAILFQCLLKCAVELKNAQPSTSAAVNIANALKECVVAAKDAMPDACQAAGVQ
jgi:hypothetical protein